MARLKGSTLQLITIILLLGCIGCNRFPILTPQKGRVNMIMLLDCSSSVREDPSSLKQNVLDAASWWADHAVNRGGGRFEVLVIGDGIDGLTPLFAKVCPKSFPYPSYERRRKWKEEFQVELQRSLERLPKGTGSAIIEGIFRATNRLKELEGDRFLIIYSDLRQVTPERWNFERSIPKLENFKAWIKEQYLRPVFGSETRVAVCGFRPYPANSDTSRITPASYGKLREFWLSLFEEWGVEVSLSEDFNLNDLEVKR